MNADRQGLTPAEVESGWRKHDGGPNPAPGECVDLQWGFGIVEGQPSSRTNWNFHWTWRPSNPLHRHPSIPKGQDQ